MKILLTNDDGIYSPGLWSLGAALKDVGELVVVAPDRDQSGIASAITLLSVVRAQEVRPQVEGIKAFAIEGTPADCVVLAVETLVKEPFDLVVSGINQGANLGLDVILSGTVGAAYQGYFRGIPSIAVSVASLTDLQYEAATLAAKALALAIPNNSLPSTPLLNVNLPNVTPDRIKAVQITTLGPRAYLESVERGNDGRKDHYWIKRNRPMGAGAGEGTDIWAVRNDRVSITLLDPSGAPAESSPVYEALAGEVAAGLELERPG